MTSRTTPFRAGLLALLLLAPSRGRADDAVVVAAVDPSLRPSTGFVIEPADESGDDDEPTVQTPSRSVGEHVTEESHDAPRATRATGHAPRRRESNGPRRVPTARGASLERMQRLGLGTRDAALVLLHGTPEAAWVSASGRARPRVLRWPVDEGAFGRGVGYVRTDRPNVPHNGVDIAAPRGAVVHAAADGLVVYSDNGLRGYGNCVIVLHADGRSTLYGHLDRATVPAGYRVRRGERIGFVGSTGHSQGPHLHFELRRDGHPLDPMGEFRGKPWIEGRERLKVLRAQPGGGHSREHLGTIEPDYAAEPEAPSRPARPAEPATARVDAPAAPIRTPFVPRLKLANAGPHAPRVVLASARLHLSSRNPRSR